MLLRFPVAEPDSSLSEPARARLWLVLDLATRKRGSLEEQLFALGRRLTAAGVAPTFVFAAATPDWMRDELGAAGVRVRVLDPRQPRTPATLWRWLRAERPALVHFHFVRASSPLVAVARLAGARVMLHDHMALGYAFVAVPPRPPLVAAAVRAGKWLRGAVCNRLVARRIAVSGFVADSLRAAEFVPPARIAVLEHGIDVARFEAVDGRVVRAEVGAGKRPVVACVSRMAPEKGVDVLVRAFARVGREALLLVAGDGSETRRCRALAVELGVADRVRFLGLRTDVAAVLAACDVAVVPSSAPEAFGLAVVEAMAAGKPVVVTDAGAMPELVDHGRCGTVVPAGDADALAAAIGRLLDGPVFARALGDAGRARARARYDLPGWVERMMALYAEVAPALIAPVPLPAPAPAPAPVEQSGVV